MGSNSSKVPPRAAGCIFLPFLVLGLFFVVMVFREAIASAATYSWQSESCRIVESEVRETSDRSPWFAYLRYTSSMGESVRSSRPFGSYREAVRFTRRWPAGSRATCYLDPRDPAGALLEHKSSGFVLLLFLPIPLLAILIGGGGFYSVVFRVQPRPRLPRSSHPERARRFVAGVVIGVGLILLFVFFLNPVRRAVTARRWRAQECRILISHVRRYVTSKGGNTFSPQILYSYTVDGHEYRSDVYGFFDSSGGRSTSAQQIVNRYRQDSIAGCYVNPADPDDATLDRDPSIGWLVGLFPLAFVAGGLMVFRRAR